MFLPNFDGDTVDANGRRKDGCGGGRRRGGRTAAAGLLTLGGWRTGRASCLFSSFGRHFLRGFGRGLVSGLDWRTRFLISKNWGRARGRRCYSTCRVALKGSKYRVKERDLVYYFRLIIVLFFPVYPRRVLKKVTGSPELKLTTWIGDGLLFFVSSCS